jgi:nucleobase:cation symporter-1, NCS1 family
MSTTLPERADALHGGAMPRGEGDVGSIETRGLAPIPRSHRYGRLWRVFTVWFAPSLNITNFFWGAVVGASGLGFWWGLLAIVLGNIFATAPAAYLARWGPKTGVAQLPFARLQFGKGVVVPGLVTWISLIFFDGLNAVFGGAALNILLGVPFWIGVTIIVVPQILLSLVGYEAIHQFERWMSIVLGVLFIVIAIKLTGVGTWGNGPPPHTRHLVGTFFAMVALVTSVNITWLLYASDYTRYLPPSTDSNKVSALTFAGLTTATLFLMILGLTATSISSDQTSAGVKSLLGGGFLGSLALVAIYLGIVSVNTMNDYTGSLSLQAINVKVWRPVSAIIGGALCFFVALWLNRGGSFAAKATDLVVLSSYWVAPFFAIITIHWLRRRGKYPLRLVTEWRSLATDWRPLAALIIAFALQVPFMNVSGFWVGPVPKALSSVDLTYFVGAIAGGIIYLVLERIGAPREQTSVEGVEEPVPDAVRSAAPAR